MRFAAGHALFLLLCTLSAGASAYRKQGLIRKSEVPDTGNEWISLPNAVQFSPALDEKDDPRLAATMDEARRQFLDPRDEARGRFLGKSYDQQFAEGSDTYYDPYSQAWRMLGFYIDCNENNDGRRQLEDGGNGAQACTRMLLWAAYVDLDYQGGGIGEYQYWNRQKKRWNKKPCRQSGSRRCAKMDCHKSNTHFKLLGLFKEPAFGDWMEQLFKHLGVCVWTDSEYETMQQDREEWPEECSQTNVVDEKGNTLYYDTKPVQEGRIAIGLYTDSICKTDYTGRMKVEDVLYDMYGDNGNQDEGDGEDANVLSLEDGQSDWNDAFDVFKLCHPCVAYNLNYDGSSSGYDEGDGEGDGDGGGALFDCNDDAGYTNVNQCMKFRTQTDMYTASFDDIVLASEQGTIMDVTVMGHTYGYQSSKRHRFWSNFFFVLALLVFFLGIFMFWKARKRARASGLTAPLVANKNAVTA